MNMINTAYIGLGANLNNPLETLKNALERLKTEADIQVIQVSPFYGSSPVDSTGPDYVNAVALLTTTLTPEALLARLQAIELIYGRTRPYKNAPRTLDLDILLFNQLKQSDPKLTLPHPRLHERAFVLQPLKDIAPHLSLAQGTFDALLTKALEQGQIIRPL